MTRSALDRAWRTLFTGSAFLLFFLGGALLSYVALPLARLGRASPEVKARRCRRIVGRAWMLFHDYMRVTRLLQYDPRRTALALPAGPFVLVANHPTLIDVTAIVAAHPEIVFVVKRPMYRSPLLGRLLRSCGHIDAGNGGPFAGLAVMESALERLRAGVPVLIFPEGTRSPERGLHRFNPGAFQIAAQAGVPLVPLLITCDPPTLKRGAPWYRVPGRTVELRVTQLPSLPPGDGGAARDAERTRRLYLEALEPAPYAPAAPPSRAPSLMADA